MNPSLDNLNSLKIAYVHSMTFRNNEANAFNAVWTADPLQSTGVETTFVMKTLLGRRQNFLVYYYVPDSQIRRVSLKEKWDARAGRLSQKSYL